MTTLLRTLMVCLLLVPVLGHSAPRGWSEYAAPGRLVPVGDHMLHLHCTGTGSPLVVLESGLGGTNLDWTFVQPKIAGITRVCSYDRAGHGWSDRGPAPRTSAVFISELAQLLHNALEAPPYIMVGHSLGGFTARGYAHFFPDQVAGLVMVDSSHEQQFQAIAAAGYAKPLVPSRQKGFVIGNSYSIPAGIPAELRSVAQRLAILPDAVRTLYDELGAMQLSARQAVTWLTLPDIPLVVLAHDSRTQARSDKARRMAQQWLQLQRELAERTPQGRFQLVPASGHFIQLDQPDVVTEAIREVVATARCTAHGDVYTGIHPRICARR